ncbi:MAG: carboxymuconolactone decarboxylase family protein [Bacteroidetes bacterium]|nr:carboxymuconolactone decarboxylase family protein [Bacteroidota bacterium]
MNTITVPAREQVSASNQTLFDNLKKGIGFVPNLFATMALSEHALGTYLAFSNAKTSLRAKEKEVINLVVSQVNDCDYCSSAHTALAKLNGFTDEQILEIRSGHASFDAKYDALVKYAKSAAENKGHASQESLDAFFAAGYTQENLVDAILVIADKTFTNYLFAVANIPVDFPKAPALEKVNA